MGGYEIELCDCSTAKITSGDKSEMNKFDDMMLYLAGSVPNFSHIVAVDEHLDLFSRIWCIAELVASHRLLLQQAIKVHSPGSLEAGISMLKELDVSKAEASRPEDKE